MGFTDGLLTVDFEMYSELRTVSIARHPLFPQPIRVVTEGIRYEPIKEDMSAQGKPSRASERNNNLNNNDLVPKDRPG